MTRAPFRPREWPRLSILNPRFRYVDAAHTDIAATFARVREEMSTTKTHESVASVSKLHVATAVQPRGKA